MKFALIGHTGHIDYYRQSLEDLPELQVVGVACATEGEALARFDAAPGVGEKTNRYDHFEEMLDKERPDVVQICARGERIREITRFCLDRGIAVMAEKPFADNLEDLWELYRFARGAKVPLAPLYGYRRFKCFEAVHDAVRDGRIGEVIGGTSQISYKWGKARPDSFRRRETFPGAVPFVGIHVMDWLLWIVGDEFVEVAGWESTAAHPDYPGCASQTGVALRQANGGVFNITLDFLRPLAASSHGDERVRITGTKGVVESKALEDCAVLIDDQGERELPNSTTDHWYTAFFRSISGESPSFITLEDAFRVTELALKAQRAVDTKTMVSLADSPYTKEAQHDLRMA